MLGLFANVVIATCDGDKAEREFALLLDEMHQEFRPLGVEMGIFRYEEQIHRQLDWAVTRLLERQQTRNRCRA